MGISCCGKQEDLQTNSDTCPINEDIHPKELENSTKPIFINHVKSMSIHSSKEACLTKGQLLLLNSRLNFLMKTITKE